MSLSAVLVGLSACGGGGGTPADGGLVLPDGGADPTFPAPPEAPRIPWLEAGVPPIAAPDIPWLEAGVPPIAPVAWDCPEGWREASEDDLTTCEPYPEDGPEACPPGQAHFPGEPGCTWVGRACADGRFADARDLGAAPLVHVDAAATAPGDGSADAPFTTLVDAFDAAVRGTTLLLAAGDYTVDRPWPSGVSVRGRCARDTRLMTTTEAAIVSAVDLAAPVTLEDLTLGPADVPALVARGSETAVSVRGLLLPGTRATDAAGGALTVQDEATVTGEAVVVRDTRARPSDGSFGVGLRVHRGGRLTLDRVLVTANRNLGVFVGRSGTEPPEEPGTPAAEVVLRDVAVRDTLARESDGAGGRGVSVQLGARLTLARGFVEGNRSVGVFAGGARAEVQLNDVVVRDTKAQESDGAGGWGLGVVAGARLALARGLLEGNRDVGVFALDATTEVQLDDVVVRNTLPQESDGAGGRGLNVQTGARLTLVRGLVVGNQEVGVSAGGAEAEVRLEDVVVRDTLPRESDGTLGRGLNVEFGASLTFARGLVVGNRELGVSALGAGTEVQLDDVAVRDTRPRESDGTLGRGLNVEFGVSLTLARGLVEGNREFGVFAAGAETDVQLDDVVVRDTQAQESDGARGLGLTAVAGARLTLARGLVTGNREAGVFATGAETEVQLDDVVVRNTLPVESDGTDGRGLHVQLGASLKLVRGIVEGNRSGGVLAGGAGAEAQLDDVVVRDTLPRESDGTDGHGLTAVAGARLTLERGLVEGSREYGVFALDATTEVQLDDVVVRDTRARESDGTGGRGLSVQTGARLTLARGFVEGNRELGVFAASAETEVQLVDVVVRDTLPRESDGARGRGLNVQTGARLSLLRGVVAESHEAGIFAMGAAELVLADVRVTDSRSPSCEPDCPEGVLPGTSLMVSAASATLDRFALERSDVCGVQLIGDSDLTLRNGLVEDHPIAVCLQSPGYPLQRLTENVVYRDNDTRVEATTFEEPALADVVGPVDP
ncbi:MAG: hypothetical protein AAGH15_08920 [Myxococcota bacterium]